MIKTGQVTTLTGFTKSITDNSYGLLDVSALSINVTAYESFAQVPSTLSAYSIQVENLLTRISNQELVTKL